MKFLVTYSKQYLYNFIIDGGTNTWLLDLVHDSVGFSCYSRAFIRYARGNNTLLSQSFYTVFVNRGKSLDTRLL
jgi:hypothetical protein